MAFLQEHFGLVVTIALALVAVVLGKKQMAWWQWFNETTFMAFSLAETYGVLEGNPGLMKLHHFIEIYRQEYIKKWGKEPDEMAKDKAAQAAAELALLEKEVRLSDPFAQPATGSTGKANG